MKMKSILKHGVLLVLCSMLLCACGKQNGVDTPISTDPIGTAPVMEPEIKTVSINDVIQLQCAEDDVLYGIDKEQKKILRFSADDGAVGEILTEGEYIQCLCYGDGKIYYTALNKLYELDPISKAVKELATFEGDTFNYVKMVKVKNSIFILRREIYDEAQSAVRFDESDEYQYLGECLEAFHLQSGTLKTVPISNIKCITDKSDNELFFYAYDDEGGFYFSTYQVEEESFTEKLYRGKKVRNVQDIAYDKVLKIAFYADMEGIKALSGETLSKSSLVYGGSGLSSLQCRESITYALQRSGTDAVIRLVNTSLNLDAPVLKAYTVNTGYNPPFLGTQIEYEDVSGSELTTKILAGDSDYDFLVLDSGWTLGYQLLRTGNYVSMNDINGVDEFFAACHNFAKDVATGEDGTIWMLPYSVSAGILFYNAELFEKFGLTLENIDTAEEVFALSEKHITDGTAYLSLSAYHLSDEMNRKYHANYGIIDGYANYNTNLYRKILEIRKQYEVPGNNGSINYKSMDAAFSNLIEDVTEHSRDMTQEEEDEIYRNTLLTIERIENINTHDNGFLDYDFCHAVPMPNLEEGIELKPEVGVYYIVINPKSEKIPWVKLYLEKLCKAVKEEKSSYILKDNTLSAFSGRTLNNEIGDILADAQVSIFPIDEVWDGSSKYMYEDQSFEDTAEEIERVMNMYLNE